MIPSSIFKWNAVCVLAAGLAFAGCAGDTTTGESSGSLSLGLELEGGVEINEVAWTISGGDMEDMSDTIDTSAPGATASVEVFGLPATIGPDYTITMEAEGEDGTTCKGEEKFGIDAGKVTDIMVFLNCKRPTTLGAVRVNGEFNICAELAKVVVSPLQTSVGNEIDLSAAAQDVEKDTVEFLWEAEGGSIADEDAEVTTFTCLDVGKQFVRVTVSDDGFGYCMHSWEVEVTCVEGDGLECIEDADCDEGEVCEDNACVPDLECVEDADCDEGEVCEDNACVPDLECVEDADCDEGEVCEDNACVPDLECVEDADCDEGEVCEDNACVPDLECEEDSDCDEGEVCNLDNECVPDVECNEDADCGLDQVCIANACYGDPDLFCNENLCEFDDDARADCIQTFILCVEGEPADEEGCAVLARLQCNECNEDSDCDAGEVCNDDKICVPDPVDVLYAQDFNDIPLNPGGLIGDGWKFFVNVFEGDDTYRFGYGGDAPQGPQISNLVTDQGGPEQEPQQLVVYSDYNCCDGGFGHQNPTDVVETNVFQERIIGPGDVGKTFTFAFQAKAGNLGGSTTANGFIKTLDPGAEFSESAVDRVDTTSLPDTWGGYTVSIEIPNDTFIGHILQFGFQTNASNGQDSGNFYDNVLATVSGGDNGGGGDELTTNGDFETGDFTGWTNFCDNGTCAVTTDNPNGGDYAGSVFIDTLAANAVIKQERIGAGEVATGDTILVELAIRGSVGPGGVVFLELFSENVGGGVDNEGLRGPFFPTNDWVQISEVFTLNGSPGDGITVQIATVTSGDAGSFVDLIVDDVSAVKQ